MYPSGRFPLTPEQVEAALKNRWKPTVALHQETVIGFANIYDLEEQVCWLGNAIVAPAHRGAGAASHLITMMMEIAKRDLGVPKLRLVCHNANVPTLLFYTKMGFKPLAISEKRYGMPDGRRIVGIQMEIEL